MVSRVTITFNSRSTEILALKRSSSFPFCLCFVRALVLANQAKEEQLAKRPDYTKSTGPITRLSHDGPVNADGTPRGTDAGVEARKRLRIHEMCKFLLLDDERVAGYLTLSIIQVSPMQLVLNDTNGIAFS
jgi:hypothetical protein